MTAVRPVRKVLMTCALDDGVGGVQVVFRDLVHWLRESGRQVVLVYPGQLTRLATVETINSWGQRAVYWPMPAVIRDSVLLSIPVFLVYLPIALFHAARLIRRKKIDIVNCHYLSPYYLHLVIAARLLRVPIVVSVHGADVESHFKASAAERLANRLIMRGANRVVACSDALAKLTRQSFPNVRRKITYIHNGLDLSKYAKARSPRRLPRPYLLCTARHVHKKGVDTLLRAFSRVLRDAPQLLMVLVGDGPLMEEHMALAGALKIDKSVVFAGRVPHQEVPSFVDGCALFVLPSRAEPFGVVLLEAALFKKPIVCTRVGGVPEIITDGVNGILVEPDDPEAMAAQILALVRNPELAARLGRQACQTLLTRFLWEKRILDYIALFEGRTEPVQDEHQPSPASLAQAERIGMSCEELPKVLQ